MFSVIIPYYNKSKYIQQCLDSVLNQTFQEFEIILVNDGSTDNGLHFISNNNSNKLTVINQENQGVSAARNTGISYAKYPFIAFLDADDIWHKQYLQKVKEVIDSEVDIKIIGTHYSRKIEFLDSDLDDLDYFKFENYFKSAIQNTYFLTSSTIINSDFFKNNKGFNGDLKKGEDVDVWVRAVCSGGNAYYINNTLVYYSNEDINQVTNSKVLIQNSFVGLINQQIYNNLQLIDIEYFDKFVSLFVYYNLYPYYYDIESHSKAKLTLKKNKYRFFLFDLVYILPFRFGNKLLQSPKSKKWLRLYMKFIIRYLLT